MEILNTKLTSALESWIKQANDDDHRRARSIRAEQIGANIKISVTSIDAAGLEWTEDLSEEEQLEIRAILAADSVSPLKQL